MNFATQIPTPHINVQTENSGRKKPTTTEEILAERGNTHGDFTDNSDVSQYLKEIVRRGKYWDRLSLVEKEAIEMICHKIGRWVSAPNFHVDNPVDIAGYATLCVERQDDLVANRLDDE